ncbi:hypothetical protein GTA08_BOTSDO07711 [Botryosphaeria dothidea]|uniref:Uncharacterized protein n=1 Tax=Botryosphaeria dothidea TaxID=55169 RepID=A0A8H4N2D8_9PEZI|nr:hypothetical protein GTA08_BOTSDO07711 [Botryosphaeria dothidea]
MAKPAAITGAPLHEHVELLATVLNRHNANVMEYVLSPLIELLNQLKSQIGTGSTTASSTGIRKIRDKWKISGGIDQVNAPESEDQLRPLGQSNVPTSILAVRIDDDELQDNSDTDF